MTDEQRIVTFDLMPSDPDYYFVLTRALGDFAARQRAEAEGYADPGRSIRWAETAESALERIEAALATRPASLDPGDLAAFLRRVREDAMTHRPEDCADWRDSCSAHNAERLALAVESALTLGRQWRTMPHLALTQQECGEQLLADAGGALLGEEPDHA